MLMGFSSQRSDLPQLQSTELVVKHTLVGRWIASNLFAPPIPHVFNLFLSSFAKWKIVVVYLYMKIKNSATARIAKLTPQKFGFDDVYGWWFIYFLFFDCTYWQNVNVPIFCAIVKQKHPPPSVPLPERERRKSSGSKELTLLLWKWSFANDLLNRTWRTRFKSLTAHGTRFSRYKSQRSTRSQRASYRQRCLNFGTKSLPLVNSLDKIRKRV